MIHDQDLVRVSRTITQLEERLILLRRQTADVVAQIERQRMIWETLYDARRTIMRGLDELKVRKTLEYK